MKWLIVVLCIVFAPIIIGAPLFGMLTSPWAPFWFSGRSTAATNDTPAVTVPVPAVPIPVTGPQTGAVSDVQRYLLAIGAGFSPAEAVIATAISIAEDGSGDPAAMSGRNQNGTYDLGIYQINSVHWPEFGGQAALTNPVNNAIAAHAIYAHAGWCSWSTYERSCGSGYTGAYAANLGRARAAAGGH